MLFLKSVYILSHLFIVMRNVPEKVCLIYSALCEVDGIKIDQNDWVRIYSLKSKVIFLNTIILFQKTQTKHLLLTFVQVYSTKKCFLKAYK